MPSSLLNLFFQPTVYKRKVKNEDGFFDSLNLSKKEITSKKALNLGFREYLHKFNDSNFTQELPGQLLNIETQHDFAFYKFLWESLNNPEFKFKKNYDLYLYIRIHLQLLRKECFLAFAAKGRNPQITEDK